MPTGRGGKLKGLGKIGGKRGFGEKGFVTATGTRFLGKRSQSPGVLTLSNMKTMGTNNEEGLKNWGGKQGNSLAIGWGHTFGRCVLERYFFFGKE